MCSNGVDQLGCIFSLLSSVILVSRSLFWVIYHAAYFHLRVAVRSGRGTVWECFWFTWEWQSRRGTGWECFWFTGHSAVFAMKPSFTGGLTRNIANLMCCFPFAGHRMPGAEFIFRWGLRFRPWTIAEASVRCLPGQSVHMAQGVSCIGCVELILYPNSSCR